MYLYGFDMYGKPKNYFLDTLSIYATLFSPLLFIYIFYSLYRTLIKKKKSLLWYISFIPLVFSLLVSFRQKVLIEDFAPYILIGLFIAIKVFYNALRVRLPQFRGKIYFSLYAVIMLLAINLILVSSNKLLYYFTDKPHTHFAYKHHIAKDLATELKRLHIHNIRVDDYKLALRLKFYGINDSNSYKLSTTPSKESQKLLIIYLGNEISTYYVTKINI
jgi:hypothetical protein